MNKSGACIDGVYQALFSRRAGNEANGGLITAAINSPEDRTFRVPCWDA